MRVQTKTSRAALLLLQCRPGALIVSDTPGCELQHGNDGFAKGEPLSSHSTFFCTAGSWACCARTVRGHAVLRLRFVSGSACLCESSFS